MKIHSWTTLLSAIACSAVMIGLGVCCLIKKEITGVALLVCAAIYLWKGIYLATHQEALREKAEKAERTGRAQRKLFGKYAALMPWGMPILAALSVLALCFSPELAVGLLIAGILYEYFLRRAISNQVEKEQQEQS